MKRHAAFQDLSRDHHHVLVRCQRFRRMLATATPWPEMKPFVDEFLLFYDSDMEPHFREEDEIVVPAALGQEETRDIAQRTLREHQELRLAIESLRASRDSEDACRRLLGLLEPVITEHVRMEEEELFEGAQRALPESALEALRVRSAQFRERHRAPDMSGPRPGRG